MLSPKRSTARSAFSRAAVAVSLSLLVIGIASCNTDRATSPTARQRRAMRPPPTLTADYNVKAAVVSDVTALRSALLNSSVAPDVISAFEQFGGAQHAAIFTDALGNMPSNGNSYVLVTAGNADDIVNTTFVNGPCVADAEFGRLCDLGGIRVTLNVPANAGALVFDVQYMTQ